MAITSIRSLVLFDYFNELDGDCSQVSNCKFRLPRFPFRLIGRVPHLDAGDLPVISYLNRVENERLNFGDYPSDALIHRISEALEADKEELVILAKRVPERIRKRVIQRPDAFSALADCDDKTLDKLMRAIGATAAEKPKCVNAQR